MPLILGGARRRIISWWKVGGGGGGLPSTALLLENGDGIQLETGSTDQDVIVMEA